GEPLDITGFTARMQVRILPGAYGEPLLDVESDEPNDAGSQITMPNAAQGQINVTIKAADFAGFPVSANPKLPAALYYDLVLSGGGVTDPYVKGKFLFSEGVTRAD